MTLRPFAALLALCLAGPVHADPVLEDGDLGAELVIDGLDAPTTLAFIAANDFFVLEKNDGQVIRVTNGTPDLVLDLAVNGCDERGLLGIALHPDFATANPKYVYLYYTESSDDDDEEDCGTGGTNRLERLTWNGTALVDPFPLHEFPSFTTNHNGGPLAFGPDEKLYGVNGDGGQDGPAQNNEEMGAGPFDDTGVIFRLNDDGSIPTDNPFDDDNNQMDPEDRYFAYGVRNSFGLAFDPESGDLWDTENGPSSNDEVNRVVAGANSGWRDIMGPGAAPGDLVNLPGSTYIQPAYSIANPVAPTGLAFASAATSLGAAYEGDLFVADYELGNIYQFEVNGARTGLDHGDLHANNQGELDQFLFASGFTGGLADVKESPDGDLYAVAIASGEIWRITGSGGTASHDVAFTGLKTPKAVAFRPGPPDTKPLKLTLQNLGTATETIDNQAQLDDLIELTFTELGTMTCDPPAVTLVPPKSGLPFEWAPNKKLSIGLDLTWNDCFNDQAKTTKTENHDDFTLEATVDLMALGEMDGDASNDACPRAATADDKGCGKTADRFRIDVYLK
jgi:glucose/arabinose dehydrogenase